MLTPNCNICPFLQKVWLGGKVVKVDYFKEQRLGLFLDNLQAQGWLKLFTNTYKECSVPDLTEFYAN